MCVYVCLCVGVHGWVCKCCCCYRKVPCASTLWKMSAAQISFSIIMVLEEGTFPVLSLLDECGGILRLWLAGLF